MTAFVILALLLIASAVFTVTANKPVHSVVGLLVNFIVLAITYLMLHAEFLAVMQIVVYSGAILILFVFVIALLSSGVRPFEVGPNRIPRVVYPAVAFSVVAFAGIVYATSRSLFAPSVIPGLTGQANVFGSVADFGAALFTRNLLPFEVTAFILMVAIIGVVLLAGDDVVPKSRRKRARERESIVKAGKPTTR